ncbi:hypothetical protein ACFL6E_07055 [Candidatus Neomarinimicrobiota bacterium]
MGYFHKYCRLVFLLLILFAIFSCKKDDKDSTAPQIQFRFPPEYSILSNIEVVRVLAQDNDGIRSVLYMADGDTVDIEYTPPHTMLWNTTAYPDCTTADSYITLTAIAKDFTGNTGLESRNFYIDNAGLPPVAVEMREPADITKHSVHISWEQSVDYYFSHYVLYRDTVSSVTENSDSLVRYESPEENSYTDLGTDISSYGLLEDAAYYYRVFVNDIFGHSTGSDSVAAVRTLLPLSVALQSPPLNVTKYTVTLGWTAMETDVAYYRIHRGDSLNSAALDSIALALPNQTTYTDTGLYADSLYFYHVYTVDEAGFTSPYNSAAVLPVRTDALPTPNLNPIPLEITKYSATVGWGSVAQQEDSSWLELFAGIDGLIDTSATPIMAIPNGAALSYRNFPISQNTNYYYLLRHRDSRNNQKWSDTLSITTLSIDDVWSGALGQSSQEKREIGLNWDAYTYIIEDDFADYTLTRDGFIVHSTAISSESDFTDTGLQRDSAYTYELTISDTSGATIIVSDVFSTRDIYPANLIDIYVTEEWDFHLAWEPSPEPDDEFGYYAIYRADDAEITFEDIDRNNLPDCVDGGNCEEAGQVADRDPASGDTAVVFVDVDPDLVRLRSYYYSILTFDSNGEFAPSNILGDTLYIYPSPVIVEIPDSLVTQTTLGLIWTRASWGSPEADAAAFHSYEVWRNVVAGEAPGEVGSSYQQVKVETDIDKTSYSDGGLVSSGEYYYTVILRDIFGLSAPSEEIFRATSP